MTMTTTGDRYQVTSGALPGGTFWYVKDHDVPDGLEPHVAAICNSEFDARQIHEALELLALLTGPLDREALGMIVREEWVRFCIETSRISPPSRIAPWDETSDWSKEVDRRIGEAVAHALLGLQSHERID